jgi:hypothetical protein
LPKALSFLRQPFISDTARSIAMLLTLPFKSAVVESASSLLMGSRQVFAVLFRLSTKGPGDDTPGPRLLFVCSVR